MKQVLSIDSLLGAGIPESIVPDEILSELKSDEYQLMLISSEYIISSDAVNRQIDELNEILKKYDEGGMLIGEAPCTKDLISCTDHDFEVVSLISIIAIFLIIALVLRSISLPVILVAVIETAIAANLCIPYYTNVTLPFVAPILISTIQLGSTVDYAILMTTRYLQNRRAGSDKREAVSKAVASSAQSILVSGIGFFAATFGVGLYSNVDIISSMCSLMARGALCSVVVVLFLLPAVLLVLDKVIIHDAESEREELTLLVERMEKSDEKACFCSYHCALHDADLLCQRGNRETRACLCRDECRRRRADRH